MDKFTTPLIENNYYHIFNRTNNKEIMFKNEYNYNFFLYLMKKHLSQFIEILAYCLLPNHFHLIVKIERTNKLIDRLNKLRTISQALSNFFNAYTKSFNKENSRYGNLFQKPYKRKLIENDGYLMKSIYYVHQNPIHHGLCSEFYKFKWSSYNKIINNDNTIINCKYVLDFFGGKEEFILVHKQELQNYEENLIIES